MAKAMAIVAVAQTTAKTQWDLLKQQKEERVDASRGFSHFHRHNLPVFQGETNSWKVDLWLQEVKKIFKVNGYPEESNVNYATYLLLGDAEYWWKCIRLMVEASQEVLHIDLSHRSDS